jgi:sugar lactone lactonase YvrE
MVAALAYRLARRLGGRGTASSPFRQTLRGVAVRGDRIHAAGDSAVRVLSLGGEALSGWTTAMPAECVAVDGEGRTWVGGWQRVEVHDPSGALLSTWRDPGRLGLVTAIGFGGGGDVFLGDATARWVRRYDAGGRWRNDIGSQHRKGGFHIPNGAVDFDVDGEGVLHVANPGMHRVERYRADGTLLGHFGRFDGRDPAGFPGCCNPTNVAVDGRGRVVVSEKAGPRVKVYDPSGALLGVVSDTAFDAGAKNMDLAVDASGRIFVADTARLEVLVFEPTGGEEAA